MIYQNNLLFVDLETSGLKPGYHEIVEIGAVLVSQETMEPIGEFSQKVLMNYPGYADPKALEVNHYDPILWKTEAVQGGNALARLINFAFQAPNVPDKGVTLAGFNFTFDWSFLGQLFTLHPSLKDPFDYHRLDVLSMVYAKHEPGVGLKKLTLKECCEFYGINNYKAHTALSDAWATFQLFKKLLGYEIGSH